MNGKNLLLWNLEEDEENIDPDWITEHAEIVKWTIKQLNSFKQKFLLYSKLYSKFLKGKKLT